MTTTPRRVAAAFRVRAAAVVLATLTLAATSAPALTADASGSTTRAADRGWAATPIGDVLAGSSPIGLRAPDRGGLRALPPTASVAFHPATGAVRFLAGTRRTPLASAADLRATARRLGQAAPTTPDAAARAFLGTTAALFGVARVDDLRTDRVTIRPRGRSVVRFQQRQGGIPVIGGELIVHLDRRGNVTSVAGEALPAADADTVASRPQLSAAAARRIAAAWVAREAAPTGNPAPDADPGGAVTTSEGLAILDPRLLGSGGPPILRLVWRIDARIDGTTTGDPRRAGGDHAHGPMPIHRLILVDALSGEVLDALERVAGGLDRTICDFGNRRTKDFRCTSGRVTRDEGDRPSGRQQVDALYRLMGQLYDFWRNRFGRDGIDGDGQAFVATVRYCLPTWCPMQNAFWEWGPQQAAFGDGWADVDDLVGHEFTHGVLDHEARLFYDYQSGAMNESFADIFGEGFDLLNDSGDDRSTVRWVIGEDIPGGAARDMQDPGRFGDPDRVRSPRWYTGSGDSGGVHSNSGVGNKAAALIADGGTFNGRRIDGIGLMKMLRVEYEVMTERLTSASDYLDKHDALTQACVSLVGTAGITMGDCRSVRDAADATEMHLLPTSSAPRQAPLCSSNRYPVTTFEDDLEQPGQDRWASTALDGGRDPWRYPPNPNGNPMWDGTWASSGRFNFYGKDMGRVTNAAMAMTQAVTVPAGGLLRFEHGYRFDAGSRSWDGGVVEASVDGGRWVDLGSRFINSGYTGSIATGRGNPLRGRRAFVSVSRGWGASRVDLSDWAGRRVRIRFRIGTDRTHGSYGWYIDDVRIYHCPWDTKAPTGSVVIGEGAEAVRQRTQSLAISGDDATTAVTRMRVSNSGRLRDGLLREGVELPFRASLDWILTDTAWGGTKADGSKRVHVQLRDRAGNWSAPFSDRTVLDTRPPNVGAPGPRFMTGTTVAAEEPRIPVRVSFTATDATSGLARTELERRRDQGDWTGVDLGGETSTAADLRLPDDAAAAWRFRARARDVAGTWSETTSSGPFTIHSTQEGSGAWTWTGDWTTRAQDDAFGPAIRTADAAAATGRVTVRGRQVALVAPRGPGLGIAQIRLDGATAATVDLYAAEAVPRTIVWQSSLGAGEHTLAVVVTGDADPAATGSRVAIDAVLTLR